MKSSDVMAVITLTVDGKHKLRNAVQFPTLLGTCTTDVVELSRGIADFIFQNYGKVTLILR
mgnify:CR=1 FL=1